MAATHANINPEILNWARERAQLSLAVLAQKLKVSEEKVESWEIGDSPPTFKQAQNFAAKTHIPFGYLFLRHPPDEELPLPDLRTVGGEQPQRPSAELLEIAQTVMQRQQWFHEYLSDQDSPNLFQPRNFAVRSNIDAIVADMRNVLNVAVHPLRGSWEDYFKLLVERIEEFGILVMRQGDLGHYTRPLSVSEFRGFAIYDPIAPVIFINQADAPSARLFTLIHEIAHIWIGQSGISDAKPTTQREEEILCNAVAAEFLVPEVEYRQLWQELEEWKDNLPALKNHFHVSGWVIARRAQSLRLITLEQYQQYIEDMRQRHRSRERNAGGPNYYVTKKTQISPLFAKTLVRETLSGRVLLREAGRLLNIKPHNISKFSRELGI